MSSDKFIDTAKIIAKRDKPIFDELINYEKTGKIKTKTRLNFTINKAVANNFKKICREKSYNMSSKIEQLMRDIIDKETADKKIKKSLS